MMLLFKRSALIAFSASLVITGVHFGMPMQGNVFIPTPTEMAVVPTASVLASASVPTLLPRVIPVVLADVVSTPSPVQKKIYGYSVKGKPIEGYEFGSGSNVIFLFGSIHGNEMGTATLLNTLVATLKANPSLVASSKKIIIIPIANPDGYYDRVDKYNADGVDLNQNFDTAGWTTVGADGLNPGPQPFSEPESQVIKSVVEEYQPSLMISYHARGGLVSPEDNTASYALGKWYASSTGYDYYDEWEYSGTATKWFTDTTGNPAITVELSQYLASDWNANKNTLLKLVGSGFELPMK